MLGQGCPTSFRFRAAGRSRFAYSCPRAPCQPAGWRLARSVLLRSLVAGAIAASLATCATCGAAEQPARLRIVWGAGAAAPQAWHGSIAVEGGRITDFAPLGVEADEAAALQLVDGKLLVDPLHPRSFDGCDLTVEATADSTLVVNLSHSSPADEEVLRIGLGEVVENSFRGSLANGSGYLLAMRAPGDRLRVAIEREHLVFDPDEAWRPTVVPDVELKEGESSVPIVARIRTAGGTELIWETAQSWNPDDETIQLDLVVPSEEGAYALDIVVQERPRFAQRLLPGQSPAVRAHRTIEFVVIDPAAVAPPSSDQWSTELTIDPANPRWWQRLPSWTRVTRLPGVAAPAPLGNAEPIFEVFPEGRLVGLPVQPPQSEPAWQAYALPVRRPGTLHAVEIQLPAGHKQDLQFCIAEPDAAGRALQFTRHTGAYCDGQMPVDDGQPASRRLVFWPRTRSPVLLLANRSSQDAAYYGSIKLLSDASESSDGESIAEQKRSDRLLAAYLSSPNWIRTFGNGGHFDAASGLPITDWNAVITASQRLALRLKSSGYNGVVACIAADGSALTPYDAFGNSPRFDNGRLASDGSDPVRKDIVEALLRIFDREGLQLVPAIQLAAPVPALEPLLHGDIAVQTGAAWIDSQGRPWRDSATGTSSRGHHYNLLSPAVQTQLSRAVTGFAERYAHHPAFAGIAVQISGDGFGLLPELQWGLDDQTIARFAQSAELASERLDSLSLDERARLLTGPLRATWESWRRAEATTFYQSLAEELQI
ncbi:hypothetical protein OAS39_00545, partial [Pirellulales bacterium]|nr:hypothetical protein [Pirellulales bacterium]